MALVTRTYLTDDLDGSQGDVSTVHIALDKTSYEIDLSPANQARLRETIARYLDVATEVKTKPVTRRGKKSARSGMPDRTRNRLRQFVSGPRPTGTQSPTVDASQRLSKRRSPPRIRFRC